METTFSSRRKLYKFLTVYPVLYVKGIKTFLNLSLERQASFSIMKIEMTPECQGTVIITVNRKLHRGLEDCFKN
jgi:hypothetical protein